MVYDYYWTICQSCIRYFILLLSSIFWRYFRPRQIWKMLTPFLFWCYCLILFTVHATSPRIAKQPISRLCLCLHLPENRITFFKNNSNVRQLNKSVLWMFKHENGWKFIQKEQNRRPKGKSNIVKVTINKSLQWKILL